MNVPLDRLYDFLFDQAQRDFIMYRWYPHGSKKLQDLSMPNASQDSWYDLHCKPVAIFHDQEPVNFSQYSMQDFKDFWRQQLGEQAKNPRLLEQRCTSRLRSFFLYNAFDLGILCHSELNSTDIKAYREHGFVDAYYWSHAVIARDWFRYAEHDKKLANKHSQALFLIYNRAWQGTREYRLKFTDMVVEHNLVAASRMKFQPLDNGCDYRDHVFSNAKFKPSNSNLETYFEKNDTMSSASADYNSEDYNSTEIEIVLETVFDTEKIHLTEKTLRPIACGQPFILMSAPDSLKTLQHYGFKTFDPWINETYDGIRDPLQRMNAVVQEMQRINQLSAADKQKMFLQLRSIAAHNRQLFFKHSWMQSIVNEFRTNFATAVDQVLHGPKGFYYKQLGKILAYTNANLPISKYYKKPLPGVRSQAEIDHYLKLIDFL